MTYKNQSTRCRGQSMVEYILLVVAIIIVLIIFLRPGGYFHNAVENSVLNSTVGQMEKVRDEIKLR